MGLVSFAGRQVGFWVVPDGARALAELPEGTPVVVSGEPMPGGSALVVAAASFDGAQDERGGGAHDERGGGAPDERSGGVAWAVVVHARPAAALLLPWRGRLFCALGSRAVLIDSTGAIEASLTVDRELVTGWEVDGDLLLLGRGFGMRVDGGLRIQWRRELDGSSFHLLGAEGGTIRLAAMPFDEAEGERGLDWRELVLDARTGAELSSG